MRQFNWDGLGRLFPLTYWGILPYLEVLDNLKHRISGGGVRPNVQKRHSKWLGMLSGRVHKSIYTCEVKLRGIARKPNEALYFTTEMTRAGKNISS